MKTAHQGSGGDAEAEDADEGADEGAQAEDEEAPGAGAGVLWGGPLDEGAREEAEEGDEDGQGARDACCRSAVALQAEQEQPQ